MSVCMYACDTPEATLSNELQTSGCFKEKKNLVLGSLLTSLLCIMGELAWGGSVAVSVGISDRWQVTDDR